MEKLSGYCMMRENLLHLWDLIYDFMSCIKKIKELLENNDNWKNNFC